MSENSQMHTTKREKRKRCTRRREIGKRKREERRRGKSYIAQIAKIRPSQPPQTKNKAKRKE